MIVRIALDVSIGKEFDYVVPPEWEPLVQIGSRVKVPFGSRQLLGYVVDILKSSPYPNLKPIVKIIGRSALIPPKVLQLAQWMSRYYCCSFELALKTVLPAAVRREKADFLKRLFVCINETADIEISKLTPRQKEVYHIIEEYRQLPLQQLLKLARCTVDIVQRLQTKGLVRIESQIIERDPFGNLKLIPTNPLPLNSHQQEALNAICKAIDNAKAGSIDYPGDVFLLYGVTGSGKTEVYLQAIAYALKKGRGAIVLVPEISLTPQTIERFRSRFCHGPYQTEIAVLHSHLSAGERHDQWHRIRRGIAKIVIGPRSAVFAPVEPLGLIVVDEEHETSYKQSEAPRYNARDIAIVRARIEGAVVVLGSATPSIETYYNAKRGKYKLLVLPSRVDERKMPIIKVVDMRQEYKANKIPIFSRMLLEAITRRLELHEQVILFLNRRGYASIVQCPSCGQVVSCPHCSVSLTYHKDLDKLCCHLCGYQMERPSRCPNRECQKPQILYSGIGTQKVEELLKKLFPYAKIQRMDSDVLQRKYEYIDILTRFRKGEIDILVGTQMIAKGLHFPRVTLVGIINADIGLHRPDFRGAERTFQIICQVAGRAGRGDIEGEVIVQSFSPFHPAIQYARKHDYEAFYEQEIEFRFQLEYPPFKRLALITMMGRNEEKVRYIIGHFRKFIESKTSGIPDLKIGGPAPAPLYKVKDFYRYQLVIHTRKMNAFSIQLGELLREYELPDGIRFTIDIDPIDLG